MAGLVVSCPINTVLPIAASAAQALVQGINF